MTTFSEAPKCPATGKRCPYPEICFGVGLTAKLAKGSSPSPCVDARTGRGGKMAIDPPKPLDQQPLTV